MSGQGDKEYDYSFLTYENTPAWLNAFKKMTEGKTTAVGLTKEEATGRLEKILDKLGVSLGDVRAYPMDTEALKLAADRYQEESGDDSLQVEFTEKDEVWLVTAGQDLQGLTLVPRGYK